MTPTDLALRPATPEDLPVAAEIYLAARAAAEKAGAMPPGVHPDPEVRAWVAGWDLTVNEVWLALDGATPVGFAHLTPTWLDGLYVVPGAQRSGVGSALLEVAKAQRPDGFGLWVFESNTPARAFYARHGLVELERTDGSANEERAPDVRMAWPGAQPLAHLRALIDEVDDALGDLLARRTALTRAVQDVKQPGSGRDPVREAEVVDRVAARVPALGRERVARIVHAVITESLDAD